MHALTGTIFALATPPGKGGVAVLRVSGPQAGPAIARLTGRPLPAPRQAVLRRLRDPSSGEALDRALVLWFPAPASFTGEDVAEFHVHGGRSVTAALAEALSALEGCRLAEPGEFSRRAFENGRLDLTAAEAIADLVAAETAQQRRQALRQMEGALAALYEDWRARLLRALAHLEADIDFPDEDLPQGVAEAVRPELMLLRAEIDAHLADARRGERLREGLAVAIVGPPNAGKSSLLNLLARREAAIVSAVAGTTRDVIEVHLDLAGWPVTFADTAGLRRTDDEIEAEGVRRAEARARAADLRLGVVEMNHLAEARAADAAGDGVLGLLVPGDLLLVNKRDLLPAGMDPLAAISALRLPEGVEPCAVSVREGTGIDAFLARLTLRIEALMEGAGGPPLTRERHRQALQDCRAALDRALDPALSAPELVAEDIRLAARALGRITGRVDVEDVLDVIFRDFCIGK